jgi:hypothetical protein
MMYDIRHRRPSCDFWIAQHSRYCRRNGDWELAGVISLCPLHHGLILDKLTDQAIERGELNTGYSGKSVVYYLRRSDGAIKIGTTISLVQRKKQHEKEHGPLEVLATEPGDISVEKERLRKFSANKLLDGTLEWFRWSRDLATWIEVLRKQPTSSHHQFDGSNQHELTRALTRRALEGLEP